MDKIIVDAPEGAKIVFSDGTEEVLVLTVQEAVIHFQGLEPNRKSRATIVTDSGRSYDREEIARLHYK